jgi:site-specific DNA-methyltransferase (adenine-specific)
MRDGHVDFRSDTVETELAREILQWLEDGILLPRVPYSRADLLSVVQRLRPNSADSDFLVIRAWGQSKSAPGKLQIETSGKKRGFRYHFGASAEDLAGMGSIAQTQNEPIKSDPSKETGSSIRKPIQAAIASPSTETLLPMSQGAIEIFEGDNLPIMKEMAAESVDLIYVDPPFNTGKKQARTQIATIRDEDGDRTGFQNRRYRTIKIGTKAFDDAFDSFMDFLVPRLEEAHRLLKHTGSLFLHLDYREIHYAKVALDKIFGRECFINEIIWAYDYGARSKKKWSAKHDNILWYVKNPEDYCFNFEEMDRIPYMAPGLVGKEKAARGKTPTDTWWHTIVSPNSHEKTGYPTQKPIGVLNRIVKVHSKPGDLVMDFFAGSGTLGESAALLGRNAVLIDSNPEAIAVMRRRLDCFRPKFVGESSAAEAIQDSEDIDSNVAVTVAPKTVRKKQITLFD